MQPDVCTAARLTLGLLKALYPDFKQPIGLDILDKVPVHVWRLVNA
jgi:hypothetical protein